MGNKRCLLSPLLFNTILEVLANAIRQVKEIKAYTLERKNNLLFTENEIILIENPTDSIRKLQTNM